MIELNQTILACAIQGQPEIVTEDGSICARLHVVNRRSWISRQGEQKEKDISFEAHAYGDVARQIERTCADGTEIIIQGKLDSRMTRSGNHSVIVVNKFQILHEPAHSVS